MLQMKLQKSEKITQRMTEIFTNNVFNKGVIPRVYKELYNEQ